MRSRTPGIDRLRCPAASCATTSTMVWAPPPLTGLTVPGCRLEHRVAQLRWCLLQPRHRHQAQFAATRRRLWILAVLRGQISKGRAPFETFHQHCDLRLRRLRRGGIVSAPVGQLCVAHRRDDDLRDVVGLFRDVELRAIPVEEVGNFPIVMATLTRLLFDHLL